MTKYTTYSCLLRLSCSPRCAFTSSMIFFIFSFASLIFFNSASRSFKKKIWNAVTHSFFLRLKNPFLSTETVRWKQKYCNVFSIHAHCFTEKWQECGKERFETGVESPYSYVTKKVIRNALLTVIYNQLNKLTFHSFFLDFTKF